MIALESKDQKMIIRALKDVIQGCIFEKIDIEKFTLFDFEKLFLALRSKSVGEIVDLELKCQDTKCNSVTPVQVDLEKINLTDLPESNIVNIDKDLEGVAGAFDLVIDCIESIFDNDGVYDTKDETRESVQAFVESLGSAQFKKIADYFKHIPTLTHNIEYKCVKCGKENNLELKGLQSFFT